MKYIIEVSCKPVIGNTHVYLNEYASGFADTVKDAHKFDTQLDAETEACMFALSGPTIGGHKVTCKVVSFTAKNHNLN